MGDVRILLDYRPALRARSGAGEYVHQVARHLVSDYPGDSVTLFTTSWKDRPDPRLEIDWPGVRISDHRVPVSVLNLVWHNIEWPPVEWLAKNHYDVVLSSHPLLMPSRRAARVVTIHDIDFLRRPERTQRAIRRDYPRLAALHARRADRVIVPSQYTAREVSQVLGVPPAQISLCPPGAPQWRDPIAGRTTPARHDGYVLFMGTLEPRKNVSLLLAAYERLLARRVSVPKLVLAGSAGPEARAWLDALSRPPLAGHVEHIGYVTEEDRQRVYSGARMLVLPSFNEGFGMPVLEAMSLGIPVIVSDRGALPELVGDAGLLVSPESEDSLASAVERLLTDDRLIETLTQRGRERARQFDWHQTARAIHRAFEEAVDARAHRN
jgi:glycosyltransferase involved in cell wall biosynthesis